MNYIKLDHFHFKKIPKKENYIYLLELNDDNKLNRGLILNISQDTQIINKLNYGNPSGNLWQWAEDYEFNDIELERYKIFEDEFSKNWNQG